MFMFCKLSRQGLEVLIMYDLLVRTRSHSILQYKPMTEGLGNHPSRPVLIYLIARLVWYQS
jgi:hypothetical protein